MPFLIRFSSELQKEIIRLERDTLSRVRHLVALEQTPSTIHTQELAEYEEEYLQKLRSALYVFARCDMSKEMSLTKRLCVWTMGKLEERCSVSFVTENGLPCASWCKCVGLLKREEQRSISTN